MHFHVMTLFPEMIEQGFLTSITGKAVENGYLSMEAVNIRDYTLDKHKKVDDYPYGGGAGMLMQAQPVYDCFQVIQEKIESKPRVIYVTPQGRVFDQKLARELSKEQDLVFLCGHYEGIDERVLEEIVTDYVSIGDYVLTGGELPAMVMMDAISRLVPGVLNNDESAETESFAGDLLEYPQYSRPVSWHGKEVPAVLLSGHHENVAKWRLEQSVQRTRERRPDLYERYMAANPPVEKKKHRKKGKNMKKTDYFDLHTHTIASGHAYSTITEMADAAKKKGLKLLGITEHAPKMPGTCPYVYFSNLKVIDRASYSCPLLMGAELNILDQNGTIDLEKRELEALDYAIASIHPPVFEAGTTEENTNAVIKAMENPYIQIIGHPDDGRISLDYEKIVKAAKQNHVILELNNASLNPDGFRKNSRENDITILKLCEQYRVPVLLSSDAHVATDVGNHYRCWELLEEVRFPEELIVNGNPTLLLTYLPPKTAGWCQAIWMEEKGDAGKDEETM